VSRAPSGRAAAGTAVAVDHRAAVIAIQTFVLGR
jgi:hypothetical protein